MIKKKIIINLTEDWFFISHFLSRAIDAEKAGYDIYVSCNQTNNRKFIENWNSVKNRKPLFGLSNEESMTAIYMKKFED